MRASSVLHQREGHVLQCTVSNAHIFSETTEGTLIKFGTEGGICSIQYDIYLLQLGFHPVAIKICWKNLIPLQTKMVHV